MSDNKRLGYHQMFVRTAFVSVSALKPEQRPEVRMDTEERQSAGYDVKRQKLVRRPLKSNTLRQHVIDCGPTLVCTLVTQILLF